MSGTVAPCFSASARTCAATSRITSLLNAMKICDPAAGEDREQLQWVLRRLPQRFSIVRSADVPALQPPWFQEQQTL